MKYFVSILVILILIFSFFGCGTQDGGEESTSVDINEKYSSVIIDSVNNGYGVGIEADYWTGLSFKKKNMKDKSCSVFGNNYSGEYLWSITDKMNPYTTDIYENDDSIQFGFRDDTGDLVLVNLMDDDFFETQPYMPDVPEPYESAIVLATEIAGEYVDDISEYTRIIEEPRTRYKERDGKTYEITYYVITFAKKVNGVKNPAIEAIAAPNSSSLVLLKPTLNIKQKYARKNTTPISMPTSAFLFTLDIIMWNTVPIIKPIKSGNKGKNGVNKSAFNSVIAPLLQIVR